MEIFQTEGVVLHALPFKEYDRILTLFTPFGVQKIFAKGSRKFNPLTSPLTVGEFFYTLGRNELHRLHDGAILEQNLKLREKLETLEASEKLIRAILSSQWPGKEAPKLYQLFCVFLKALGTAPEPTRLPTIFYLKTMRHEGILQLEETTGFRYGGECLLEENEETVTFTEEENCLLHKLTLSRSLEELFQFDQPAGFSEKVEILFGQAFSPILSYLPKKNHKD